MQLLAVGHNVSKRVEVSEVFHWQVDQRQQPVNGVCVDAQAHSGMSLCCHEPVRTGAPGVGVWIKQGLLTHCTRLHKVLPSVTLTSIHYSSLSDGKLGIWMIPMCSIWIVIGNYLGVVGQNRSSFSGSLLETKGFSTMTGKNTHGRQSLQICSFAIQTCYFYNILIF